MEEFKKMEDQKSEEQKMTEQQTAEQQISERPASEQQKPEQKVRVRETFEKEVQIPMNRKDDPSGTNGQNEVVKEEEITAAMYDQLMALFGEGSQLFTMEMPGRVLNQLDYAYPMKDYNSSTLKKPYAVAENEFRLADGMVDVAPVVQGSNGKRFSENFSTLVHNYTPDIMDIKDFITDKMQLRLFLLEPITDSIDGVEITCSRMEFCQKMYMRYLKEKYNWDQQKIEEHLKAQDSDDLDEYAKWLATASWTKDQQLENMFQDAVVRGFYHEIMTILGFLDIASPSERLAKVKANQRSSVRRSLDSSMDILPVQLQPSNWFRSLTPNFTPKDLTLDPTYLSQLYKMKRALLQSLEAELRVLLLNQKTDSETEAAEASVKEAKARLDAAEKSIYDIYGKTMVEAVKLIFEVLSKGDILSLLTVDFTAFLTMIQGSDKNFLEALGLDEDMLTSIATDLFNCYMDNSDYFNAYDELLKTELELVKQQTGNYSDRIQILKERISVLSNEIAQIEVIIASGIVSPIVDSTTDSDSTPDSEPAAVDDLSEQLLPGNLYNEDSEFMDVIISKSQYSSGSFKNSSSYYSSVKGAFGCFFLNVAAQGETAVSETKLMQEALSSDFTLGFRATKVTIDRGGWFDSGIFDLSSSYRRVKTQLRGGAGLTVSDIMNSYQKNGTMNNGKFTVLPQLTTKDGALYTIPAYPTAFLVVKDIVFKATLQESTQEDYENFKKSSFTTAGSLFGFRVSGGGASESFCGYSKEEGSAGSFILRIPGPQILGWFQELPPEDRAKEYQSLSKSEYFNEIIDSLKEYSEKLRELDEAKKGDDNCVVTEIRIPGTRS